MDTTSPESALAPPPNEPPPLMSVGPIGWVRENLFNSISNAILTIVSAAIIVLLVRGLVLFVLFEADWTVVTANPELFAIGQYPREESWRPYLSFGLILFLVVGSFTIGRVNRTIRLILGVLWILSPFVIWILLLGFAEPEAGASFLSEFLPRVRTQLWSGLLLTLVLTIVSIVLAFPLGILLALGRRADNLPIIRVLSTIYIELFRGVPLISVLFIAQVMLPLFLGNTSIDVVFRAIAGLTLFEAAYLAEIIRGGLQAIPDGQVEAAQALGMPAPLVTILIVLPQALRIVIPTVVGQFINLFQDTTLVSIVTLLEFLGITAAALSQDPEFQLHKTEAYIFVAAVYFMFSFLLTSSARRIERSTARMGGTFRV